MTVIQFLTVLFVIFAGSRAVLRFHDRVIGYGEFFFWACIWTAVLVIIFNPSIADMTADIFGLQRGTDAMFFIAVVLLFYLIFRMYVKLDIVDRNLTRLNSETSQAIHKHHKEI